MQNSLLALFSLSVGRFAEAGKRTLTELREIWSEHQPLVPGQMKEQGTGLDQAKYFPGCPQTTGVREHPTTDWWLSREVKDEGPQTEKRP